jgi:lactoylglutathione lyase
VTDGPNNRVSELRLVVTASDYDVALAFYRDALGLPEIGAFSSKGGRVTILDAGRATLELADPAHAAYVDEVEVGRRAAGHIRVAFQVPRVTVRPIVSSPPARRSSPVRRRPRGDRSIRA